MIKNYLLTALRNLRRNKLFSLINVLSLSEANGHSPYPTPELYQNRTLLVSKSD